MSAQRAARAAEMTADEDLELIRRLEAMVGKWEAEEPERRKRDRRGKRLFEGEMWNDGVGPSRLAITSNKALATMERVIAEVLRGTPRPEVEAINPDDEEPARVAEGALSTNWRAGRMNELLAVAYRLASFTRQVGVYHYWRHELRNGIGDVDRRIIPGHRLIFDDRTHRVADMEFIGFEEEMTRAKLITLFPNKAEEIEEAATHASSRLSGQQNDPLRSGGAGGGRPTDRLVATGDNGTAAPYQPVTSINMGPRRGASVDPLSERVKVRFLWIDDTSPKRVKRPRLHPHTKRPMYEVVRDEDGKPKFDHDGHDVLDSPAGPVYVPRVSPQMAIVMDDVIERKYKNWRHVAYIGGGDRVKLWDVDWDGPAPISIVRDRLPMHGFDAPGTALRAATLGVFRNVLWTILAERVKLSLAGTWLATPASGLKKNKLVPETGSVFFVNQIEGAIKEFPAAPIDVQLITLLDKLDVEMANLLGVTPMMQGQAAGRADSPSTYEQIADQSGGPILDRAKLVDQWAQDAAEIDLWFMQGNYTHEHVVEIETALGDSTWTEASALTMRGKFAVRVEVGSTLGRNSQRDKDNAKEAAQMGIYALPMLAREARIPHWRQAMKQRAAIQASGPQNAWMLGQAAAPPAQQAMNARARTQRTHHRPGGK